MIQIERLAKVLQDSKQFQVREVIAVIMAVEFAKESGERFAKAKGTAWADELKAWEI